MKKILLAFFFIASLGTLNAQADTTLHEYTGKFLFPEGSPVREIGVIVENEQLTATSVMGNSELRKTDTKDVFEIVSFAGIATFKRNGDGKITGLLIQVQDVTMEGEKAPEATGMPPFRRLQ